MNRIFSLWLFFCAHSLFGQVTIASKNFPESTLLAEIMAQCIEHNTSLEVERRFGLGGTLICYEAVRTEEINVYPEYTGTIKLGQVELRNIHLATLRKKIFLFPQELYIFNGTIMENIRYGNPSASIEEVIYAAGQANIKDFVHKQLLGYNYMIGDMGANLSGGQKNPSFISK